MVFVYGQKMKKKKNVDLRSGAVYSAGQTAKVALSSLPALLTPVILIGGILAGVFTPTEAAAVSVVYLAGLGLIYRKLPLRAAFKVLADSAATAASILIVLGASGLYGWILTREGAGRIVADAVANMGDNPIIFLIFVNIILLLVGTFMESAPAILIFVPILGPIAADLGINPLHFGVIVLLNLVIGLLTPPVGMVLFVLGDVTRTSARDVFRGTFPFLMILVGALMVITFVPALTEGLPHLLGFR
jgi:tripartite ATP-independent transporter DctM subunit